MADSYTQVPPNSTGNKLRTRTRVIGVDTVHEQAVFTGAMPTYYALADAVALDTSTTADIAARLGEADDAARNNGRGDKVLGFEREPSDGGTIWYWLMPALVALGDHDEALAKLTTLAGSQSFHPANQIWIGWETADLHPHPGFRALMRQHGVDVDREPFAFNRPAATDSGN